MSQDEERGPVEGWRALLEEKTEGSGLRPRVEEGVEALRARSRAVDIVAAVFERDRHAAGTLLGSALALRLFLFFIPFVLVVLGVAGVLGRYADLAPSTSVAGLTGTLADELDYAFRQGGRSAWLSLLIGLVLVGWAGRSLTRALVLSSALAWRMSGRQRTPLRVVGVAVGVFVGTALIWAVYNRIRVRAGFALATASLTAVLLTYAVLWLLLFLALPRRTSDPGAALPGASIVALALTGMQAISQLYLAERIDSASALYGAVGVSIAFLGWFFIIGRSMSFAFAVNAVLYERLGSLSNLLFALPGLRALPKRFPSVARFFDL